MPRAVKVSVQRALAPVQRLSAQYTVRSENGEIVGKAILRRISKNTLEILHFKKRAVIQLELNPDVFPALFLGPKGFTFSQD